MKQVDLKDLPRREMEDFFRSLGEAPFRGRQVMRWIYHRGETSFEGMTDIKKGLREKLKEVASLSELHPVAQVEASDGTQKFLFPLGDGHGIESVLIPDGERLTLCLSTQVGCGMGCRFCLTARGGLARDLTTAEIVEQILAVRKIIGPSKRITNIVFMGMGEPLANYRNVVRAISIMKDDLGLGFSRRRITLSTVGLLPEIRRLFDEGVPCRLAISLNAADQKTRSYLMPISRRYPLEDLLRLCRGLPLPRGERITFEYVLLEGVNDRPLDAHRLAEILQGIRCKINLIPYNEAPGLPFRRPAPERVSAFQEVLLRAGYTAIIRESRGGEIGAACGQLRGIIQRGQPSGK